MDGMHGRARAYQVEHLSASGRMRVIGWWERRGSWFVNIAMSCCCQDFFLGWRERVYGSGVYKDGCWVDGERISSASTIQLEQRHKGNFN
jgi:hypothetical protein